MAGGSDATFAYRAGVDVVVLVGSLTERSLAASIAEAGERGLIRLRRAGPVAQEQALPDVGEGMAVLTTLLKREVETPMLAASHECNGLTDEVRSLLRLVNALAGWAALVAPPAQLESVAKAAPADAGSLLAARLGRIQSSIHRAEEQLQLLQDVCTLEQDAATVNALDVARLLAEPLARHVSPCEFRIDAREACIARVPRPVFVCMLLALVGHASQAVRESPSSPGTLEVRIAPADQEATVVVEVFYTGQLEASFGPDVLASGDHATFGVAPVLRGLRDRARQYGGELLLQGDDSGMTARLLLPTPAADAGTRDRAPDRRASVMEPAQLQLGTFQRTSRRPQ
jgi:hypothetical protein